MHHMARRLMSSKSKRDARAEQRTWRRLQWRNAAGNASPARADGREGSGELCATLGVSACREKSQGVEREG